MKKNKMIKKIKKIIIFILSLFLLFKIGFFGFSKKIIEKTNDRLIDYKSQIYLDLKNFKNKINIVSNVNNYLEKIDEIEKENQNLKLKLNDYEKILEENKKIKDTLNLKQNFKLDTIIAKVILEEQLNNEYIYISKGFEDGIVENQVVMYDGNMIGIIEKVFLQKSKVRLLVNKDSKISVVINNEDLAILRGNGDNTFSINKYNKDILDDNIYFNLYTSGISDFIPGGIKIGSFKVIDKTLLDNSKELRFESKYKYLGIKYVLVVKEIKK